MNAWGIDGCRVNLDQIIVATRTEVTRRKLFEPRDTDSIIISAARKKAADDFEHNARWLILLAIKLTEEDREPDTFERFKLRWMRFGNRMIGKPPESVETQA